MKKHFFYLVAIGLSMVGFAQNQKSFTIQWDESKRFSIDKFSIELPWSSDGTLTFDYGQGIRFVSQWPTSQSINERSLEVTNVVYSPISSAELKNLPKELIPSSLGASITTSVSRGDKMAYLTLSPIIKTSNNSYSKVTSFSISYNYGNANRAAAAQFSVSSSVLASGDWYKFYVDTTGVFKLSKSFIESLGISTRNLNPQHIRIFGNGGRMIPYVNSQPYPIDPEENAIMVIGEEDGVFDDGDYVLFYAQGPNGYDEEKRTNINCYNDRTYYYINVGSGNGKRIQPLAQPSDPATLVIDTFQEYRYYEEDKYNLAQLGRRWFGNRFDVENTKTFDFDFPNLVTNSPIKLNVYAAAVSEINTSMGVSINGNPVTTLSFAAIADPNLATEAFFSSQLTVGAPNLSVTLEYNNSGNPSALGYLDYISIEATRALSFVGNQFQFKNSLVSQQSGVAQYNLSNASQVFQVWDITDIYNATSIDNSQANSTLSFKTQMGDERRFVIVAPNDYYQPKKDSNSRLNNQDIKGTIFTNESGAFQDVDYLIVTPARLLVQAERLAEINRNAYGLNAKAVTLEDIYAEFGCNVQDIGAIRNLVKYIYDNASTQDNRIKYLCMFGDASFDYKDRISNNTNIVPSWHSYSSFNLTSAFISDDFFGMMDANEGSLSPSDRLDIAVGRMIVDTPQQAKEMVDKVELYHKDSSKGNWRNNFVVISDDVDDGWETVLENTTDAIGDEVHAEKPFINVTKIHSDAYQQESSAGGDKYPKVTEAIIDAIEKGALVINYFGHGGEDGLARERIFQKPHIIELNNTCKFNCFVTVTCEFTRFDNPFRPTAGEYTFWNANGGAIGLITTTRQIFVSVGITFNSKLDEYLFSYSDNDNFSDDEYPSMAEALRLTKIDPSVSSTEQRRLVFFIGDPAMKLAFGSPDIKLTHINDVPLGQGTDNLSALSHVKLSGEVTDVNGNVMTDYNGTLSTVIFDKDVQRQTLGNDGTVVNGQVYIMDFTTLGAAIFRGQASITNGLFEFEFVVPRDIAIPLGTGKVSFYATTSDLTQDNSGASVGEVVIGGINENAAEDNQGPLIQLYMNDENFVSGGITNGSPVLLAKLQDDNGINTASGIGHDIVAILDGDETNPYVINDYYQTEVDDYQRGSASYPLRDLEPGLHTLTLKAWDVYNNSSTAEIQFVVFDEDQKLVIDHVLNYPNPFVNYTEFWFNHNSSTPLDVSVQIFTVSGKLVKTINAQTNSGNCCNNGTSSLSRDIIWDGRDDFGDKIGKGVYVYKLTVYSPALNKKVEKFEKLVIL